MHHIKTCDHPRGPQKGSTGSEVGLIEALFFYIALKFSPIVYKRDGISLGLGGCRLTTHSNKCKGN